MVASTTVSTQLQLVTPGPLFWGQATRFGASGVDVHGSRSVGGGEARWQSGVKGWGGTRRGVREDWFGEGGGYYGANEVAA